MGTNSYGSSISAYKSVAAHSVVHEADPHQLICLLMDGALDRMVIAKSHMARKDLIGKATVMHRVTEIIMELRESLNPAAGGDIATNLDALYEYMISRLLVANMNSDATIVDEVINLLKPIRDAWVQIGPQVRSQPAAALPHNQPALQTQVTR